MVGFGAFISLEVVAMERALSEKKLAQGTQCGLKYSQCFHLWLKWLHCSPLAIHRLSLHSSVSSLCSLEPVATFFVATKNEKFSFKMWRPGLLYTDTGDHVKHLLKDLVIFAIKSVFYILEAIFLSLVPDRFRTLKVLKSHLENVWIFKSDLGVAIQRELWDNTWAAVFCGVILMTNVPLCGMPRSGVIDLLRCVEVIKVKAESVIGRNGTKYSGDLNCNATVSQQSVAGTSFFRMVRWLVKERLFSRYMRSEKKRIKL